MTDPLDTPPVDHGSDRFDYVEVQAPDGVRPIGEWWDRLIETPCPDCRANVFAKFIPPVCYDDHGPGPHAHLMTNLSTPWKSLYDAMTDRQAWDLRVAHDESCPMLKRIEAQDG